MKLIAAILTLISLSSPNPPEFHTSPACWESARSHHRPFDPYYEEKISVSRVEWRDFDEKTYSPNQGYWHHVNEPDLSTTPWGPGSIFVYNEREYLTRIEFDEVKFMSQAQVTWINEKLLHIEVGWGTKLGTHMIWDAESESPIWREMFEDGGNAYNQFKAACEQEQWKGSEQCQCPGT